MSQDLQTVIDRMTRLEGIYVDAMKNLNVLQGINDFAARYSVLDVEHLPPNEHAMLLRAYSDFFYPVQRALLRDAHMQTAKLLLLDKDSLHIHKLVEHAHNRGAQIKRDLKAFKNAPPENDMSYYAVFYRPLSDDDMEAIMASVDRYKHLILKLDLIRNKRLGHEDLTIKSPNMLSIAELRDLLGIAREVFGKVNSSLGTHSTIRDDKLEDSKTDTARMLERLYTAFCAL